MAGSLIEQDEPVITQAPSPRPNPYFPNRGILPNEIQQPPPYPLPHTEPVPKS